VGLGVNAPITEQCSEAILVVKEHSETIKIVERKGLCVQWFVSHLLIPMTCLAAAL